MFRRETQARYRTGPGKLIAFGDFVSQNTMDRIQDTEKKWMGHLCLDAIVNEGLCEESDIQAFFLPRLALQLSIPASAYMSLSENRLGFELKLNKKPREPFVSVFASNAITVWRIGTKRMLSELLHLIKDQLELGQIKSPLDEKQPSYVNLLARVLDAVYPTRQLQLNVLTYPQAAHMIVKRRLVGAGLLPSGLNEDTLSRMKIDSSFVISIVDTLLIRLELAHRYLFEVQVPDNVKWIVGWTIDKYVKREDFFGFPGQDANSFGYSSDGSVWHKGHRSR